MEKISLKNIYDEDVEIEIVDNQNDATFITHSGTFHADEVMASVILLNKFGSMKIYRCNKPTNFNAFVYDVGFKEFDHHAIDFDKTRPNGIKYASCGLVWEKFGKDIIKKLNIESIDSFFESIDKNLIMDIDRDDNGQTLGVDLPIKVQSIPNLIANFNPTWDDLSCETTNFLKAILFANEIFNNLIKNMISKEKARKVVEEKINESKEGILVLDKYMPWKDIVLSSSNPKASEIIYAVFPSKREGYNVVATPVSPGSFDVKKPFPKKWAGKEEEELQKLSGVDTITFCHKNLFICACKTFDDAIKIAKISLKD